MRLASVLRMSILLLTVGSVFGCAGSETPAPHTGMVLPPDYDDPVGDTVRVVTWNVEHFVDRHNNPYIDADREDHPSNARKERVQLVMSALEVLDADLVILQEAESEAFLQRLVRNHGDDLGYRFTTSTESPNWYMNVVLLSRFPLGVVRNYADVRTPIEGQTNENGTPASQSLTNHRLWMADVRVRADQTWTIVGAHLKAGRTPRDRGWRLGQIRFLHVELRRLLADRPRAHVLVAGDLNSLADSPELRLLLNDPARAVPESLATESPHRRARFVDPLAGRPTPTHPSDDPTRQLDYLLPNSSLSEHLVDGSMHVARPLPADSMAVASDHLPVVASFVR